MTISVNDEPHPIRDAATLQDLLGDLALAHRPGIAVALNDAVVPRREWPARRLADSDRVLVIRPAQGG